MKKVKEHKNFAWKIKWFSAQWFFEHVFFMADWLWKVLLVSQTWNWFSPLTHLQGSINNILWLSRFLLLLVQLKDSSRNFDVTGSLRFYIMVQILLLSLSVKHLRHSTGTNEQTRSLGLYLFHWPSSTVAVQGSVTTVFFWTLFNWHRNRWGSSGH